MTRACVRIAAATLLACAGAPAFAVPMSAAVAVTADDSGGASYDADFSIAPGEHVSLYAGAGHSEGSDETADLTGTLLSAGISLHGERGGFALGYDSFDDSTNYRSTTIAGRAWWSAGDFEFSLLGRQRDLTAQLTLELPLRTLRRELDFAALGGGLQVSYSHGDFNAYAMALTYEYDDEFDQFVELAAAPQVSRRPRIEALFGSFMTQAQGAIDRQIGLGAARIFGRQLVSVDLASVHDAILDADSTSLAVTWAYAQSAHVDWSLSAGMIDSDAYGNIAFAGVGLSLGN